jgi:site-specific DNA-methyltransferase (adenine-specific)
MDKLIIGDAVLINGDIREAIKGIQADLLLTDPPYKLTSGGCTTEGGIHNRLGGKGYDNSGFIVPCDIDWPEFFPLFYGALRAGKDAYVMCNDKHIRNMLNAAEDAGFNFHNMLIWNKRSVTPNRWYMKQAEFIGFFYKSPAKTINNPSSTQIIIMPQVDESGQFSDEAHPTKKQVMLMRHYIENSSEKGDVVLDPFMGSGTTGVAALRAGRKFIGIEKDARFFKMACRRLEAELKSPPAQESLTL